MYDLTKFASFKGADVQQVKHFFFRYIYIYYGVKGKSVLLFCPVWGFGWPVNANRKVKERYALALNNGSGKVIETRKASYAEWGEGGGVVNLADCLARWAWPSWRHKKKKRTTSAVAISKCQFL